jgi:hypothetical protein
MAIIEQRLAMLLSHQRVDEREMESEHNCCTVGIKLRTHTKTYIPYSFTIKRNQSCKN